MVEEETKKKFVTIYTGWNGKGMYQEIWIDGVKTLRIERVEAVDFRTRGNPPCM
jgi:hypothetical protein